MLFHKVWIIFNGYFLIQLQKVSVCVDILIIENQWIIHIYVDLSNKVFFKMKK